MVYLLVPGRVSSLSRTLGLGGLVLLAASAVLLALTWWRSGTGPAWSVWPLATLVTLFLPQFFLPPAGRMAYGVAYAVAAALIVWQGARRR